MKCILWQGVHCAAVLNLYPYKRPRASAPEAKGGTQTDDKVHQLWEGVRLATQAIQSAYSPDGINTLTSAKLRGEYT